MRFEQLKYFVSIAETHSINKTSLKFYTTHQGISRAIRQLENEIGAPLFVRSTKGMFLTEDGKILLPVAQNFIRELHNAQLRIRHKNYNKDLACTLYIYGTIITNSTILPPLLEDFSILYPKTQFQIKEAHPLDVLRHIALHPDSIGIAPIFHHKEYYTIYHPYLDQVSLMPLHKDEFMCVVGNQSPLANLTNISLEEFSHYPIAMMQTELATSSLHPLIQLLKQSGNYHESLATQSRDMYRDVIQSGQYVGISSRLISEKNDSSELTLLPFKEDLTLDIMLITNSRPKLDSISQAFISLVSDQSITPLV